MGKKNVEAIYPLSPSQQGMLFETLAASEPGIHIEQSIWNLSGDLDVTTFERAWQRVVERHSILRTSFVWKNLNEPLQVVLQWVQLPIERQDWRDFSAAQQQEKLEDYLRTDRLSGFKLSKAPLMRLALFQINKNGYQFVWSFHHILMDGWCLPLIAKEVLAFYETFGKGQDLTLKPGHPYTNYITWLKQQDISRAETFWRSTLQGFKHPTPLGREVVLQSSSEQRESPLEGSKGVFGYGEQQDHLPASATAALQTLTRQHHLTLNILTQGVWALLLSRYSGNLDVLFGTTVSGRPADLIGVEAMIGLFINTLPMRVKVSPEVSLLSWLKDIQTQNLEQQVYEYCSVGQIRQWGEVPGALSLYESILVFENYPVDLSILKSSNLTIDIHSSRFIGAQTKYALTILVRPGSKLTFQIVYDRRRFGQSDITPILKHFLTLLKAIVDDPEQLLATLLDRIPIEQIPRIRPLQTRAHKTGKDSLVSPRTLTEKTLSAIWTDILGLEQVGIHDNFFEIGGYSMIAVHLIAKIQQQFGRNLPITTLLQNPTIEHLARILDQHTIPQPWSPVVAIQPNGSKPPLFCVHPSGGTVFCYTDLARHLGSDQPFYGLQAPGLEEGQEPYTQIEDMAKDYIKALQDVQPQGPYFLAGWSFGGVAAFEMAQQLCAQNQQVSLLAELDVDPPSSKIGEDILKLDDAAFLAKVIGLHEIPGFDMRQLLEHLRQFSPDEQFIYIIKEARRAYLIPPDIGPASIRRFIHLARIQVQAAQHYIPQRYPGKITFFQASEREPDRDWGEFAVEGVETIIVPGNHHTVMLEPHVRVLAEELRACLERAQAGE